MLHAIVSSGNVAVIVAANDEKGAMAAFEKMMRLGPPFDNSFLCDIAQIKNMRNGHIHYAIVRL